MLCVLTFMQFIAVKFEQIVAFSSVPQAAAAVALRRSFPSQQVLAADRHLFEGRDIVYPGSARRNGDRSSLMALRVELSACGLVSNNGRNEARLAAYLLSLLSFLVLLPGHPEHGPFYIVRGLINAIPRFPWKARRNFHDAHLIES